MERMHGWQRVGAWLRTRLFPPACFVCSRLLDLYDPEERESALCRECLARWKREKQERCPICGEVISRCECMTEGMTEAGCQSMHRLLYYRKGIGDPVQNRLIYRFKRRRSRRTAAFLAAELYPALTELMEREGMTEKNTLLVPVPRSRAAYLEYGTDQAEALARALSECSGIPMAHLFFHCAGQAKKQKELSANERFRNAARSYRLRGEIDVKGRFIVLLDDIVTTGATVSACARKLRRRGVRGVHVLTLASDDL